MNSLSSSIIQTVARVLNVSAFAHSAKSKTELFIPSNLGILPKRTEGFYIAIFSG